MKKIFRFCFPPREDEDLLSYSLRWEDLRKIHKAVVNGELTKLHRKISSRRWNINEKDQMGRTALHVACAVGNLEVVKLLLENKNNCLLSPRDSFKRTPLIKAVQCNNITCSQFLLEHGADPNFLDIHGLSALHYAVMYDYRHLAELLINYSADVEAKDKSGLTPLMLAEKAKMIKMVELLTKNKANINAVDEDERPQHLVDACRKDRDDKNSSDKDSVDEDTKRNISSRRKRFIFKKLGAKVTPQIENAEPDFFHDNIYGSQSGTDGARCHSNEETQEALHTPSSTGGPEGDGVEERMENKDERQESCGEKEALHTPSSTGGPEEDGVEERMENKDERQENCGEKEALHTPSSTGGPEEDGVEERMENKDERQESCGEKEALHTPSSTGGPEEEGVEERMENKDETQKNCGDNSGDCATASLDEIKHFMKESEDTCVSACLTAEPSIYSEKLKGLHQQKMLTLENVVRDAEAEEENKMYLEYKIKELNTSKNTDEYTEILTCHEDARKRLQEIYMSIGDFSFKLSRSLEDHGKSLSNTDHKEEVDLKEFEDVPLDASFQEDYSEFFEHQKQRNKERIKILTTILSRNEKLENHKMTLECKITDCNTLKITEEYSEILKDFQETRKELKEMYMSISQFSFKLSRSFEDHGKSLSNTDHMIQIFMKEWEDANILEHFTAGTSLYSEKRNEIYRNRLLALKRAIRKAKDLERFKMKFERKIQKYKTRNTNTEKYSEILKNHREARKKLQAMYLLISEFSFKLYRSFEDQRKKWTGTDLLHNVDMNDFIDAPLDASFLEESFLYFERHQKRNQRRLKVLRCTLRAWEMLENQQMILQCKIAKYNTDRNTQEYTKILKDYQETRNTLHESYSFISEYSIKLSR